ncbi:MAG: MFS transporter [Ectothiorhodospiraceae bacterium]|nr:MFS transporter [Chromatiales bacterium]MCP5153517.1 MFS transporter [Ectothiorhodospiraceae bacterium]
MRELLAARRFAPLFATQFLGAFNDNVFKQGIVILVTFGGAGVARADSAFYVTLCAGVFIAPFFLLSGIAGRFADHFEKAWLIRRVKLAEIVIMTLGAIGFVTESLWLLLVVLFLMGAQSTAFGPLKYAILPQHLRTEELTAGNGLVQMATYVAILVGTMLGGFAMGLPEHGPAWISATVLAVAVLGFVASRAIPPAPPADPDLALRLDPIATTRDSMAHAREDRAVFVCVLGISWFWFVGATYFQLLPTYARDALAGGPRVVTLLLTAFSVGIGAGSLACDALGRRLGARALVVVGGVGLSLLGLAPLVVGPPLEVLPPGQERGLLEVAGDPAAWPVLGGFLALAVSGGLFVVPLYARMQALAPVAQRARIVAANNVLNAALMVVSALMTLALLRAGLGPAEIFGVVAGLGLVVVARLARAFPAGG